MRAGTETVWTVNVPFLNTIYQGSAYNIESGVFLHCTWDPPTGQIASRVIRTDDLRRLASVTVGQATRTDDNSIPVGSLDLCRTATNELVWSAGEVITGGTLRIVKMETSGLLDATAVPDAVYPTMAADVSVPVQPAGSTLSPSQPQNDTYGAWTDVFTILENTETYERRFKVDFTLNPKRSWTPTDGGDRGGANVRIQRVNASDVVQQTLIGANFPYVRAANAPAAALSEHGTASGSVEVDLAAGEKLRVQAQGSAQVPAAGKTIVFAAAEQFFDYREHAVLQGASAQRQQISRAPHYAWFYRYVQGSLTPTFTGLYDGVAWRNLGGWLQAPLGVIPAGTGTLWHARARVIYDESTTFDWNVSATVYPGTHVRYSLHRHPVSPSDILAAPPTGAREFYISSYTGGGIWSPFEPVLSQAGQYEEVTSRSWYPGLFTDFYTDIFTEFSFLDYTELLVTAGIYGPNGNNLLDHVEFPISLQGSLTTTETGHMPRIPTAASTLYAYYQAGVRHQWAISDRAQDSGTASFYDRIGFNMRFERPTGEAGDSRCDRITVWNPASFDAMRRVRFSIALWRK